MAFTSKTPEELQAVFAGFIARVHANNNVTAMRLAQKYSPVRLFQPVVVACDDLGRSYLIDVVAGRFEETDAPAHLRMHSESLWFVFQNTFGFDTLAVNGCFEEAQPGGFARAAKSISIETLNNLSFRFGPGLLLEPRLIAVTPQPDFRRQPQAARRRQLIGALSVLVRQPGRCEARAAPLRSRRISDRCHQPVGNPGPVKTMAAAETLRAVAVARHPADRKSRGRAAGRAAPR